MKSYNVKIAPNIAVGQITAPHSKSISHRALICAALAHGESFISGLGSSADIDATVSSLAAIGAVIDRISDDTVRVRGFGGKPRSRGVITCRESGSTLRFLIPICLLSDESFTFSGTEKLLSRPLDAYRELFCERMGRIDGASLTLLGGETLRSGNYTIAGNVSSQFVTGLLFALPLCEGDSTVTVGEPFESASYVDLTLSALVDFGVTVTKKRNSFLIRGSQSYTAVNTKIEGDASSAAFFEALNILGGNVRIDGLNPNSLQGDRVYSEYLRTIKNGEAKERAIDLSDCPDLAPILFTVAAECGGAVFTHTDRLRIKESDRIEAMRSELSKFGAEMKVTDKLCGGTVEVLPRKLYPPNAPLSSHNDHRIAMSLSVLATRYGGTIEDAGAVGKSFPEFYTLLSSLGIKIQFIPKER